MLAGLGGAGAAASSLPLDPLALPLRDSHQDVAQQGRGALTSAPPGGQAAGTTDRAPCPQAPASDAWGLWLFALLPPMMWATPIVWIVWTQCCSPLLLCSSHAIEDFGAISQCECALS